MKNLLFVLIFLGVSISAAEPDANRLTYLASDDPFHPQPGFARLTTPQWIGEEGVEAAVIISIDDLREPAKYEAYLRPILDRLKKIDGRAPASIFCNQVAPDSAQFQTWLKEGLSLEVHTLTHPCPLLGKGGFEAAAQTYHGGVDLLAKIPGNFPVAFRMPCCDSMNSSSPRFFAEIFARPSREGRTLAIDSSVFNIFTPRDPSIPRELVTGSDGGDRFRKYFPTELKPPVKVTFDRYGGYIEDYPYPYVIGGNCWEFPCAVPSDWEAFNAIGAKNPRTTDDWKAVLDITVLKQGVMTFVLHPHGWSDPQQIVALIDHAVAKHGSKVKFLSFREALARLEKHALAGQSLRSKTDGGENGVRLLDLNADGFMDVVVGNEQVATTRVWDPQGRRWNEAATPVRLISGSEGNLHAQFGVISKDGAATLLVKGKSSGAWTFAAGKWKSIPPLLNGLENISTAKEGRDAGVRLRDFDRDGIGDLLVSNASVNAIHRWSEKAQRWEPAPFALPKGVSLLNERGEDNGLRFADFNGDGFDDLFLSNEQRYAIHLWTAKARPDLGWTPGWSQFVRAGDRKGNPAEPPQIVRAGPQRNNGAWFKDQHLIVQNEETAALEAVVDRRSFKELIAFDVPPPKSPDESLAAIRVPPGFQVELVAAEPLVVDPVAFEWDARGRLWVVEMRDYPLGIDGKNKPGGAVKVLEDLDRDGRYDKAATFLEDLPYPTGVIPWRNGVIICAAPDIFYAEDTDHDGRADLRRILYTGFSTGNQQHRANGFEWGLDGWIYGANGDSGGKIQVVGTTGDNASKAAPNPAPIPISGRDFRFRPDTGEFEAESGQAQYGRRRDDWGRWFANNNSTWLWHYTVSDRYLRRNPKLAVKSVRKTLANYDASSRVFPISAQPIRFNQPQSLGHVTSACSPSPYRDELFGEEFASSFFICEPVHNAVHREVLAAEGATFISRRAESERDREFLASEDVWFRPSMVKTGPDGALYIADMYRFVLEHPEWIAPETQSRLDLRAGADKGRIYRVSRVDQPPRKMRDYSGMSTSDLVTALDSPNGWQRDTVQRLLYERGARDGSSLLETLARTATRPKARVQALAALDVLGATKAETVIAALRDPEPGVRLTALRVSESLAGKSDELLAEIVGLADDSQFIVRHQLAFTLGEWKSNPAASGALAKLAERDGNDPQMRIAILSSVAGDSALMTALREDAKKPAPKTPPAPVLKPTTPDRAKVIASFAGSTSAQGDAARGAQIYRQLCSACHRFKEEGREVGPDLATIAGKPEEWLLAAVFDPNQAVEARYQAQHVKTKDGAEWLGLVVGETANNITLRTAEGTDRALLRTEIETIKPLGRSLMPEGVEGALKPQDFADLIKFLRAP